MVDLIYSGQHKASLLKSAHVIGAAVLFCTFLSAPRAEAAESVESLRYGASLYHFFQSDYFEAMTELMVGQAEDELGPHMQGSELLRGGMSLSYGMDQQAQRIFENQLASAPEHIDRSRAWFYLGKVAWQRGETERALEALSRVDDSYEGELAEEARYMKATAQLRANGSDDALDFVYSLPKSSKWRYYLHYNTAVTLAEQGLWAAAEVHFKPLEDMPRTTPEELALYERAQSAAGYSYLAAERPGDARSAFEKIGLDGAASEKALLGFGWASANQGDYLAALSAWKPLTSRSMLNPSARESLLAVPYAYENLGRSAIALTQYQAASEVFERQIDGLNEAMDAFGTAPVASLLGLAEPTETSQAAMSWVYAGDILPEGEFAPYLQYLITRHSFQVVLRELRDLYDLRRRMLIAQERLSVLREVDSHQQSVWQEVLEQDTRAQLAARAAMLREEHRALEVAFNQAVKSGNGRAFADKATQARWQRLDRAIASARELERDEQGNRLGFLRGVMLFNESEGLVGRQWKARKELRQLAALAQETEDALARVNAAIAQRSEEQFLPRIDAMDGNVSEHLVHIESAVADSELGIRQLAVAALAEQAEQMRRALGQSGLAIARLYDAASRTGASQ